jgi:flagellar motility protein MotE (MotC chaperone)
MKAKSAAKILEVLEPREALPIILNIKPKTLANIFAKMKPESASQLTKLLSEKDKEK